MKKIISGLLGILFVVLVVVGVFICTYVFNQPSRSGDSRELISGTWTDKDANITFEFSDEGDFTGLKFRRTGEAERYSFL